MERESTETARVYEVTAGAADKRGWYVSIEGDDPTGPYKSAIDAGKVARAAIISRANPLAGVGTVCPGFGFCRLRQDEARAGTLPDRCSRCPGDGEWNLAPGAPNRRGVDRRVADSSHFAGADRRMRDRRLGRLVDHRLDRLSVGRNKYAVVNMRKVMAIDGSINGTSMRGAEVINALNVLRRHGMLNDGDAGTEGEFFVLMLKDQFADAALSWYAAAARSAGLIKYADDIGELASRAGHGSRWCKLPD